MDAFVFLYYNVHFTLPKKVHLTLPKMVHAKLLITEGHEKDGRSNLIGFFPSVRIKSFLSVLRFSGR